MFFKRRNGGKIMNLAYSITLEEAWREYSENADFRLIVQSGDFIYLDNRFVPAMSQCPDNALRFEEAEIFQPVDSSFRGDPKGEPAKKITAKYYDLEIQKEAPKEIIKMREASRRQYEKLLPQLKPAWARIYDYLQLEKANSQTFQDRTLLNNTYFHKAKKGDSSPPSMHTIVSIVAGYDWGIQKAEELLKLAGHAFSPVIEQHDGYLFVLSLHGCCIHERNAILIKEGLNPLGSGYHSKGEGL
jgi:hypothetical protein